MRRKMVAGIISMELVLVAYLTGAMYINVKAAVGGGTASPKEEKNYKVSECFDNEKLTFDDTNFQYYVKDTRDDSDFVAVNSVKGLHDWYFNGTSATKAYLGYKQPGETTMLPYLGAWGGVRLVYFNGRNDHYRFFTCLYSDMHAETQTKR